MSSIALHFGPVVSLVSTFENPEQARHARAFALVSPDAWGRADWREPISAVLHPADLEACGVTIAAVLEAIAFFTATEGTVREVPIHATPAISAFVVKAAGYRAGPAS